MTDQRELGSKGRVQWKEGTHGQAFLGKETPVHHRKAMVVTGKVCGDHHVTARGDRVCGPVRRSDHQRTEQVPLEVLNVRTGQPARQVKQGACPSHTWRAAVPRPL